MPTSSFGKKECMLVRLKADLGALHPAPSYAMTVT
jgi:hypothetical protein